MATKRKLAAVPKPEQVETENVESTPVYQFEPMTEDLQSRLNVWGNSTMITIQQIEKDYPQWAQCLMDYLGYLKASAESVTE